MNDMDDDGKTELIRLVERPLQDKRERDEKRRQQSADQLDIETAFAADRLPDTRGFEPT